jgi:hypothetical protein
VGQVYELPIPLYLYLLAAAATVAASFAIRMMSAGARPLPDERRLLSERGARVVMTVLRVVALATLGLALISGLVVREAGATFTTFSFWVGLIVGTIVLQVIMSGIWQAADPWASIERFYRIDEGDERSHSKVRAFPWWIGPGLLYGLFWFELVSGAGFDSFWVVAVLIGYSVGTLILRSPLGRSWERVDPLSILFGFAGRPSPLRLAPEGIFYRGPMRGLEEPGPMPLALYASVFVLLASTTFDNLSETVGWTNFLDSTGLDSLPGLLVDTVALAALALPFYASFLIVMEVARRSLGDGLGLHDLARRFGWSLVPIGVAYVLAHNAPLLITGVPELIRLLSDPFEQGWNLLGTGHLFEGFVASPRFVWFLEIAIIVVGHVTGVLAAHRAAVRVAPAHDRAVRSEYALTGLMSLYTIATLWLLAQPLVT